MTAFCDLTKVFDHYLVQQSQRILIWNSLPWTVSHPKILMSSFCLTCSSSILLALYFQMLLLRLDGLLSGCQMKTSSWINTSPLLSTTQKHSTLAKKWLQTAKNKERSEVPLLILCEILYSILFAIFENEHK